MKGVLTQQIWLPSSCLFPGEPGTSTAPWPAPGEVALGMFFPLLMNDGVLYAPAMRHAIPVCQGCLASSCSTSGVSILRVPELAT